MFENIINFFKKLVKSEDKAPNSKDAAKERLHLVLMQDRANVSADFLDLMRQEIIEVIKKYIEVDESSIDVRLTNKANEDGTTGAPALYANIPIMNIKNEMKKETTKEEDKKEEPKQAENKEKTEKEEVKQEENKEDIEKEEKQEENKETEEVAKEDEKENIEEKNEDNKEEKEG